jgi:two-component system CheB/CheR fusion protein
VKFSITTSDEGRPITNFAHQLDYDDLVKDARTVIALLKPSAAR